MSEEIGKWEGFGIWDTSTHAQPLADRPAQQIKADLTFNLRMKVQLLHALRGCAILYCLFNFLSCTWHAMLQSPIALHSDMLHQ